MYGFSDYTGRPDLMTKIPSSESILSEQRALRCSGASSDEPIDYSRV